MPQVVFDLGNNNQHIPLIGVNEDPQLTKNFLLGQVKTVLLNNGLNRHLMLLFQIRIDLKMDRR